MPNIFKDGGGAGIGSFIVVFKNGRLAPETDVLKLRGAYEAGEQIYISVIDEETKDALVPASGWIDEELKLHLAARDFDDGKTYILTISDAPIASEIEIEYEIEDAIDLGGEEIPTKEDIQEELSSKADLVDGKVPASQLPSYVDDVVEYEDLAHFPEEGVADKIYLALDTGYTYRWSGTEYVQIGGQDLSEYYTKTEVNDLLDAQLAAKQDTLVSGTNIKTVNGESLLGEGNIETHQPVLSDWIVPTPDLTVEEWFLSQSIETILEAMELATNTVDILGSATFYDLAGDKIVVKTTYFNPENESGEADFHIEFNGFVPADEEPGQVYIAKVRLETDAETGYGRIVVDSVEPSAYVTMNDVHQDVFPDWSNYTTLSYGKQGYLDAIDGELLRRAIRSSDPDNAKPSSFTDKFGNQYTFVATSENSADVYITWNLALKWKDVDSSEVTSDLGQSPVELWSVSVTDDPETGDTTVSWTLEESTHYATVSGVDGILSSYSTTTEVQSMIDAAIGAALAASY